MTMTSQNSKMIKVAERELAIADETIGGLLDELSELQELLAAFGGHVYPCQAGTGRCFCGWLDVVEEFGLHDL